MENGWQVKCGAEVTSSTDMNTQPSEMNNKMNMNSASSNSNMLKFGTCKSAHHDIRTSFFSLPSPPPSSLQDDLQQQSNPKSYVGRYYPNNFVSINAEKLPRWSIVQNNENSGNSSFDKTIHCASPHSENGQINHDSESNMTVQGFLQLPITDARNQTIRGCPRVFCMGACGNLLLSNTGLLGIHCSCHDLRMSVSNFCQHSGLSDVNPGSAVHMESGESIAQWRKLHFQKFGIRAPEDDRGWDWPEGLLTTPCLENTTVPTKKGHLVTTTVNRRGLSNDSQSRSRSIHSKITSESENSFSFGFQNLQRVENNGQPTQQGWGSGCFTLLDMRSKATNMHKTTFEERSTHSSENSEVIMNRDQCLRLNLPSVLHSNKKEFHGDPQNNGFCVEKGASRGENDRDTNSYHFTPRTIYSQPHVDRSSLTDFSCNASGGPVNALEANKLALQPNKDCTLNAKCEINHSIVGSESSFKFYVKQMEKSGFFSTYGNNGQFSSIVPSEKFNLHQMGSMRPGVSSASKYKDNANQIISFQELEITQTMSRSSSNFNPMVDLNPDSLKKVDYVTPNRSNGSFRALAYRNPVKQLTEKVADASFICNQRMRADANEGQRSNTCSVSDSWVRGPFLEQGCSEGIYEHPFNLGHNAKMTFPPYNGCIEADNSRIVTRQAGTNNCEDLEGDSCYVASNSEVSDKCVHGSCGCQPERDPSLRGENNTSGCNLLQGFSEDSCSFSSAMSHSKLRKTHPNRESNSKGICINSTLNKQAKMKFIRDPESIGSKLINDSLPILQVSLRNCNIKVREQLDDWVKVFGANAISTSDQVSDLKGKESSNVSSVCSEPIITSAPIETTKTGSYTVDGGDPRYTDNQLADQGSTADRSWSSVDAMTSVKSSQSVFCSEVHCLNHEYMQKHSTTTELQSLGESEARFGNVCNSTLNQNNLSNFRKRKHKTESLAIEGVSSSPSESPTRASIYDADDNAYTSNQDSANTVRIPCKRDLSGVYNFIEAEIGDRKSLKGNDERQYIPENVVSKRLKQDKLADSDESSKCDENVGNQKAKPVAMGKYGVLCNHEWDIDKIKPPKIVPLSHVLAKFNYAGQDSQCNDFSSCTDGDHSTNTNETREAFHKEGSAKSKTKGTCVLSPCKSSMRGKELIVRNAGLSGNSMHTLATEFESERIEFRDCGKNDCDHCKSGINGDGGQSPCSSLVTEVDALCCVCGISTTDETNCLLECSLCLIRIHQDCYGISRVPKGDWYCRPCRTSSKDVACVLCGYGGGAMTRAFGSQNIMKSLLKAWNIPSKSHTMHLRTVRGSHASKMECKNKAENARFHLTSGKPGGIHNSITSGLFDRTVKQWVHVVCGLWTPGSRCPYVSTMSAFDVSGVSHPKLHVVCYMCKRRGGSCIRCCVDSCNTYFHPWCAHQKGLLEKKVEDGDDHDINFYGRCLLHANHQSDALEGNSDTEENDSETEQGKEPTCARTEVYKGKIHDCEKRRSYGHAGKGGSYVSQVQLDAWNYINKRKMNVKRLLTPPVSDADYDFRKEYARYKQAKGWKQLTVYKSGIHGFGLYSSVFIPHGAMVVEYIGEIVGLRVADKREMEYLCGRRVQYKGACYFFKIDKEHIIDATHKGGIARFVNHSCQPNCAAKVIAIRGEKKVVFFAEKDIYPGQEVTYDYHFNHEDEGKKIPCFCNSKKCKRYLN